jgi:demethylmenaquinone methyltransferase/2-methoxy-6-polyprenyl-1,4-benzoquinol methylase
MRNPGTNAAHFAPLADDVFSRIAGRYDLMCDLFSLGIHRHWKSRVARHIAQENWTRLLDAASGTGDVVLRVAAGRPALPGNVIVSSDLCPQMQAVARQRASARNAIFEFRLLDVHSMPEIADASFDLYSISLALKICDRQAALREAMRVLRPGGRLVTLEASTIVWPWLQRTYLIYMNLCMPLIGWLVTGGDSSAYRYLLNGIEEFPAAQQFADELAALGFVDIRFEQLSLGIVAIHTARKPA